MARPVAAAELAHPRQVGLLALQVGDHLEDAVARPRRGRAPMRRAAPPASSACPARGRAASGAGSCARWRSRRAPARSASLGEPRHLGDLVGARPRARGRARRARRRAARSAAPARRRRARAASRASASRYSGNDSQRQSMPSCSAVPGNVLDALHQLDEEVLLPGPHRREADAAVAHHQRRDAVPARRRQHRVPGHLAVVVRVHVDPARRDQQVPARRSRAARAPRRAPTAAMTPPSTATSPSKRGAPGAVDDRSAANHQIVHRGLPGSRSVQCTLAPPAPRSFDGRAPRPGRRPAAGGLGRGADARYCTRSAARTAAERPNSAWVSAALTPSRS